MVKEVEYICNACDGSGEGPCEGWICSVCNGTGIVIEYEEDEDED